MKKLFLILAVVGLVFGLAACSEAASATFSWLPNSETDLAGYKIHWGATCDEYTGVVDVGLPATKDGRVSGTVADIPDGATCYAATAYDANGHESGFSDVVNHDDPPGSPVGFTSVTVNVNVTVN